MLKNFHMFFIGVSTVLAVGIGLWGFSNGSPILGLLALAAGGGLVFYLNRFRKKARQIGLD
jgi:hypothetical protein